MLKARQRICLFCIDTVIAAIFILLSIYLFPKAGWVFTLLCSVILFFSLELIGDALVKYLFSKIDDSVLQKGTTSLISNFIQRLRFCYSLEDFYETVGDVLEVQGDCSVLFINRNNNYVLYNSPDKLTCKTETMNTLDINFSDMKTDGVYFIDKDFGLTTVYKSTRGFFLVKGNYHLYIFCKYTHLFDKVIYNTLFEEYIRFLNRQEIITNLSEITELSREWTMLADVQKAFLPLVMPEVRRLELASYFKPLVNVSGDYYSVLPLDEHKTLVMLGDVSGKGLAAALVMGLVLNTVKIMEDKEDLSNVIHSIDRAIKDMKFQDKYTVLFIGIIDTEKMTIRYVNASMSDPIIVTRSPEGYRIKPLSSNCSLIGIIDLDTVVVAEQKLFRGDLILMASDGISEAMDKDGVELGTTDTYLTTIKNSANKSAGSFVSDLVNLVLSHSGGHLRDDVTMLVAKVEG